jgi:hypothetical protein
MALSPWDVDPTGLSVASVAPSASLVFDLSVDDSAGGGLAQWYKFLLPQFMSA